jgi:hypothetical protein
MYKCRPYLSIDMNTIKIFSYLMSRDEIYKSDILKERKDLGGLLSLLHSMSQIYYFYSD